MACCCSCCPKCYLRYADCLLEWGCASICDGTLYTSEAHVYLKAYQASDLVTPYIDYGEVDHSGAVVPLPALIYKLTIVDPECPTKEYSLTTPSEICVECTNCGPAKSLATLTVTQFGSIRATLSGNMQIGLPGVPGYPTFLTPFTRESGGDLSALNHTVSVELEHSIVDGCPQVYMPPIDRYYVGTVTTYTKLTVSGRYGEGRATWDVYGQAHGGILSPNFNFATPGAGNWWMEACLVSYSRDIFPDIGVAAWPPGLGVAVPYSHVYPTVDCQTKHRSAHVGLFGEGGLGTVLASTYHWNICKNNGTIHTPAAAYIPGLNLHGLGYTTGNPGWGRVQWDALWL